ncbi:MAG: hypothetical protein QMC40_06270 [Vicingaceae bacterium]
MASRTKFKKQIKNRTNLLIEDAFIESINGDAREAVKMDSIIDEVIDERHVMLNKVCVYPNRESRANIKAHFNQIGAELQERASAYEKKIGRVG